MEFQLGYRLLVNNFMKQLIQYENGQLVSPKCKFNKSGLEIDQAISYNEWFELGGFLKKVEGAVQFWIGDWINFGEKNFGEKYTQALEATDYEYGTLRNFTYTAKMVDLSRRHDNLTFQHHTEVIKLEPEKQKEFLDLAEENEWSSRELKQKIQENQRQEMIKKLKPSTCTNIIHGDFRTVKIEENSIDFILTDPPYPEEYLDLWSDLSAFANRVLKPSGFMACYSGQLHLPEALNNISRELIYYWTMCLYHTGATQIVNGRNMMCRWKPIFIMQKPPFKMLSNVFQDYVISENREKSAHEWQQSESGATNLLELFTKPGDTVLDPFCGAGTFPYIAHKLGREAIGIEINKDSYLISKARFNDTK